MHALDRKWCRFAARIGRVTGRLPRVPAGRKASRRAAKVLPHSGDQPFAAAIRRLNSGSPDKSTVKIGPPPRGPHMRNHMQIGCGAVNRRELAAALSIRSANRVLILSVMAATARWRRGRGEGSQVRSTLPAYCDGLNGSAVTGHGRSAVPY